MASKKRAATKVAKKTQRRNLFGIMCSVCGGRGHNARTCPKAK